MIRNLINLSSGLKGFLIFFALPETKWLSPVPKTEIKAETLLAILSASLGYIAVSGLSAIVGYLLAIDKLPNQAELIKDASVGLSFIVMIMPYHLSRTVLLERSKIWAGRPLLSRSIRLLGLQVPILTLTMMVVFVFLFDIALLSTLAEATKIFFAQLIFLLPFLVLGVSSYRRLRSRSLQAFHFSNRILLPAFATILIPLTLGWSISGDTLNLAPYIAGIGFLLILIILTNVFPSIFLIPVLTTILIATTTYFLFEIEVLLPIVVGSLITLALGSYETMKRIYLYKAQKDIFNPPGEGYEYFILGTNWSIIAFPWLFSLLFLFEDTITTYPIVELILLQSIGWTMLSDNYKTQKAVYYWGLTSGYFVLFSIIFFRLQFLINGKIYAPFITGRFSDHITIFLWVFSVILALGYSKFFERKEILKFFHNIAEPSAYLVREHVKMFYCFVVFVIFLVTVGAGYFSLSEALQEKAYESALFEIISITFVGISLIRDQIKRLSPGDLQYKKIQGLRR